MRSTTMHHFQASSILLRRSSVSSRRKRISADTGKYGKVTFGKHFFEELTHGLYKKACALEHNARIFFPQQFEEGTRACSDRIGS